MGAKKITENLYANVEYDGGNVSCISTGEGQKQPDFVRLFLRSERLDFSFADELFLKSLRDREP